MEGLAAVGARRGQAPYSWRQKVRACVRLCALLLYSWVFALCVPISTHVPRRSSLKNLNNTTWWHDITHFMYRHLYNNVLEGRRRAAARRGVVREGQLAVQHTAGSLPVSRRPSTVACILLFSLFLFNQPILFFRCIKYNLILFYSTYVDILPI
jgi:hypothetical protein